MQNDARLRDLPSFDTARTFNWTDLNQVEKKLGWTMRNEVERELTDTNVPDLRAAVLSVLCRKAQTAQEAARRTFAAEISAPANPDDWK